MVWHPWPGQTQGHVCLGYGERNPASLGDPSSDERTKTLSTGDTEATTGEAVVDRDTAERVPIRSTGDEKGSGHQRSGQGDSYAVHAAHR